MLNTQGCYIRPINGSRCRGEGLCGSLSCQRAPRVPWARQKYAKGSGTPVLTLPGSGEAEIVPDWARGLDTLMTSRELGRGRRRSWASGDLVANTLLSSLVGYAYHWYPTITLSKKDITQRTHHIYNYKTTSWCLASKNFGSLYMLL
jgi:hypothetical protein